MPTVKANQLFPLVAGFVIPAVAWVMGSFIDFDRPPPPAMIAFWFSHSLLGLMCLSSRRPGYILMAICVGPAVAILWILDSHHPNWSISWHVAEIALSPVIAGTICGMLLSKTSPMGGGCRGLLGGAGAAIVLIVVWMILRHVMIDQFTESPQKIDQYLLFLYGPVAGGCLWVSLRIWDSPQAAAERL
jgi:hypothetical protein